MNSIVADVIAGINSFIAAAEAELKAEREPKLVLVPTSVWLQLQSRQASGYYSLVPQQDGAHQMKLTELGRAADTDEARQVRLTILHLQGAGIRVHEALPQSMQPLVPKPNFVAMRAKLLGKKGRWS